MAVLEPGARQQAGGREKRWSPSQEGDARGTELCRRLNLATGWSRLLGAGGGDRVSGKWGSPLPAPQNSFRRATLWLVGSKNKIPVRIFVDSSPGRSWGSGPEWCWVVGFRLFTGFGSLSPSNKPFSWEFHGWDHTLTWVRIKECFWFWFQTQKSFLQVKHYEK